MRRMKSRTSPPSPHPKHQNRSESEYTVNEPSTSSWKGQTPWRTLPLPLRRTPDTSTVSPRGYRAFSAGMSTLAATIMNPRPGGADPAGCAPR